MPSEDIFHKPYWIWNDQGVSVSNLYYENGLPGFDAKVEETEYQCRLTQDNYWALFRKGPDAQPLLRLTDSADPPTTEKAIRTILAEHVYHSVQRPTLVLLSQQQSREDNGFIFLLAGKDFQAKYRGLEAMNRLRGDAKVRISYDLNGAKELPARLISLKSPDDYEALKQYLNDGVGVVPTEILKNLDAKFIQAKIVNENDHFEICSKDEQIRYGTMPSSSTIDQGLAKLRMQQDLQQESVLLVKPEEKDAQGENASLYNRETNQDVQAEEDTGLKME